MRSARNPLFRAEVMEYLNDLDYHNLLQFFLSYFKKVSRTGEPVHISFLTGMKRRP
jgi:hypothetical protein